MNSKIKRDFRKWRNPVRGRSNPESMDNAFWHWSVENRQDAYSSNNELGGPDSMSAGPCWCFSRMGMPEVTLPDGRSVAIAGEHEDHYDPDFYIYNDVVVTNGDQISIYGYPESVFPPTDFHSATLVGTDIFLIGNLGYPDDRRKGHTQVFRLDTDSWQIHEVEADGAAPGWIHRHTALFDMGSNQIRIHGGKVCRERIVENFNDYALCLDSFRWLQLTDRKWKRWLLERVDREPNRLWEIRNQQTMKGLGFNPEAVYEQMFSDNPGFEKEDLVVDASEQQLGAIDSLYSSPIDGGAAEEDKENFGQFKLDVEGTKVRFSETIYSVTVTVEGQLALETTDRIVQDLKTRLETIENSVYRIVELDDSQD